MDAAAERELDLAEREMGGYGVEEERERLRIKQQAREAKLARKEDIDRQAAGDEHGEPMEGGLTLDEYIMPTVQNLINALGGWEDIEDETGQVTTVYRPGDNIVGCLNDIFKLSRLDEEDDERTVARTFARTNLMAELVTVIVELSDKGAFGRKVGSKAARLVARLTWPIDVAAELMEADDLAGVNPDFASLTRSQLEYKALLLRPGVVLDRLMELLLPNLATQTKRDKDKARQETEVQALLYIIRNLAMIKDAPSSTHMSADNVEKSSLQSGLIDQLQSSDFLPLLITLASSSNTREFNQYNVLVLDIVHLLWRGVNPADLGKDQKLAVRDKLSSLLEKEDLSRTAGSRNTSSRHSRFGATVAVQAGGGRRVILSKGGAVKGDVGTVMDLSKKRGRIDIHSIKMLDPDSKVTLQPNAARTLKSFTEEFIRTAFNTFVASILNDIRREQPKIRDKDNLRLAQVCSFVVEFFTLARQMATDNIAARTKAGENVDKQREELQHLWNYGYLAEFCNMATIVHLNKRLYLVMDDSPPGWVEIQATCHCFTRLLLLLDSMSASGEEGPIDAAQILQHKIYYNAELLERPIKLLIQYKNQSLAYLDTIIQFSYVLLRMLERHSKENAHSMVIRKLKRGGKKKRRQQDGDSDEDHEEDYIEENVSRYQDHLFKFGEFEEKWRDERVVATCLAFLEHYEEFESPDQMKRCVNILYRIAVKLKTEGMFFKVSILALFKEILDNQAMLPKGPASKELINLIKYLLRQFFKEAEKSAFIVVEALFPKNRNQWQAHSTWIKDDANTSGSDTDQGRSRVKRAPKMPQEVQVRDKTLSNTQQIGIAVGALLESGKMSLVTWAIEILKDAAAARNEIVFHTDGLPPVTAEMTDEEVREQMINGEQPSEEALSKFAAHSIVPDSEDRTIAVSNDSQLKLLFRLLDFKTEGLDNEPPLQWFIPMEMKPTDLEANARIIELFIREPIVAEGESAVQMLMPKRRAPKGRVLKPRKAPKRRTGGSDSDASTSGDDGVPKATRKRKARQAKELAHYTSAAWIEDSDDDTGDAEFFAKEAAMIKLKESQAAKGIQNLPSIASQGRKKRKAPKGSKGVNGKRQKSAGVSSHASGSDSETIGSDADDDDDGANNERSQRVISKRQLSTNPSHAGLSDDDGAMEAEPSPGPKQPRPKPKPRFKAAPMPLASSDDDEAGVLAAQLREEPASDGDEVVMSGASPIQVSLKSKRRVIMESEDDDDQ